jgi:hypothetical protein
MDSWDTRAGCPSYPHFMRPSIRGLCRSREPLRHVPVIGIAPRQPRWSVARHGPALHLALSPQRRDRAFARLKFIPCDPADQCPVLGVNRTSHVHRRNDAIDPTETCRESYCLLSSTSFQGCSWGEIDLAQDSRDEPGIPILNGSVSRRSIPVCGVLLAGARRCISR